MKTVGIILKWNNKNNADVVVAAAAATTKKHNYRAENSLNMVYT